MPKAPHPTLETTRLASLRRYDILDTPAEPELDEIVKLAAYVCGVPIALISLVDETRQWFKARVGLAASETPRDLAFCAHAILRPDGSPAATFAGLTRNRAEFVTFLKHPQQEKPVRDPPVQ